MFQAVPARVALGVTTLLAMSTTMGSIQKSLPPVAYTKVREYTVYSQLYVECEWPPFWPCPLQWAAFRSLFLQWPTQRSESTQCTVSCMWGVNDHPSGHVHYNWQHSEVSSSSGLQVREYTVYSQLYVGCEWPPFWPCPLQWAAFRSLFLQWPTQRSESTQCTVSCMWCDHQREGISLLE